jgi:PPOX class probable FMN-dependent enzyme
VKRVSHRIQSIAELDELYGEPVPRALAKELDHISDHYRTFIEHSPFVVLATVGPEGLDCSPRGDPAGFIRIADERTVLLPDRRGNNRIDSLRNIVRDPRASLLFLVPGIGQSLRINGKAEILVDHELLESFKIHGKPPRSVIRISVESVYYQCSKAIHRSRLWEPESRVAADQLPSPGQMLKGIDSAFDAESYDRNYPEHLRRTIY